MARDVARAGREPFDVIVVGGGVYGAMLLLEAARSGLRAVAVERDDFGAGTSWNHLRILHGGLRYLQRLDLVRHRESVEERRRFLAEFPDFVRPLPCWMPLEWSGLRNPLVMATAARIDDWLSPGRNRGVAPELALPRARVWSGLELARHTEGWGLDEPAAALRWFDAFVPRPRRLLMEILHRACEAGALALNYTEALAPMVRRNTVEGLLVRDQVESAELELRAPLVLNAAGPEAGGLAERWDRAFAPLGPRTLAWNVLLDITPGFGEALAIAAPRPGAPILFGVPWEGRLLAGTGHTAAPEEGEPIVPADVLSAFLADLDAALPGLGIRQDRVLRVYSGFLPGVRAGSAKLSRRPIILDHGARGGLRGLWSVSGVKFTTARRVAETAVRLATGSPSGRALPGDPDCIGRRTERLRFGPDWRPETDAEGTRILESMVRDEAVVHLDDLLFRRTALGDDPRTARVLAPELATWFGDDESTRSSECERVMRNLDRARSSLGPDRAEAGR